MQTISEEYREMNRILHEKHEYYGAGRVTSKWYPLIMQLVGTLNARSILDYGAGKCKLAEALSHLMVNSYDPSIPAIADPPEPADLVVCLDVLEHIEPELLDNVLDDLKRLAIKGVFLTVSTRPAGKFLSDGRNAHLIQKPANWWLPKLMERWNVQMFASSEKDSEFYIYGLTEQKQQTEKAAA